LFLHFINRKSQLTTHNTCHNLDSTIKDS